MFLLFLSRALIVEGIHLTSLDELVERRIIVVINHHHRGNFQVTCVEMVIARVHREGNCKADFVSGEGVQIPLNWFSFLTFCS
ncbi:hypothetical protein AMTRI_Chr07g77180 [Amborella trichopoda]